MLYKRGQMRMERKKIYLNNTVYITGILLYSRLYNKTNRILFIGLSGVNETLE
jgi:hypothetical protein